MQYQFQALYFDGVSSSPRSATVRIRPDALVLSYTNETGYPSDELIEGPVLKASELSSHARGEVFTLRLGRAGVRSIEIRDPGFQEALASIPAPLLPRGARVKRPGKVLVLSLVLGMFAFLLLSWFVLIPELGDVVGNALPPELEKTLGTSLVEGMISRYNVDDDKTTALYKYAASISLPDADKLQFFVCESGQANAFAVMGGSIFVLEPILDDIETSDEMAALLFHEYAHLKLRHTSRSTMRTLASYFFISLVLNDSSGIVAVLLQNLDTLQQLEYSRDFEREADAEAIRMLHERGMDTEGFVRLMEALAEIREDGLAVPEILSTHPDESSRINSARALVESLKVQEPVQVLALGEHEARWLELKGD